MLRIPSNKNDDDAGERERKRKLHAYIYSEGVSRSLTCDSHNFKGFLPLSLIFYEKRIQILFASSLSLEEREIVKFYGLVLSTTAFWWNEHVTDIEKSLNPLQIRAWNNLRSLKFIMLHILSIQPPIMLKHNKPNWCCWKRQYWVHKNEENPRSLLMIRRKAFWLNRAEQELFLISRINIFCLSTHYCCFWRKETDMQSSCFREGWKQFIHIWKLSPFRSHSLNALKYILRMEKIMWTLHEIKRRNETI